MSAEVLNVENPRRGPKSQIDEELFRKVVLENKHFFQNGMIRLKHPLVKECSEKFKTSDRCIYLKIQRFVEKENFFKLIENTHQNKDSSSPKSVENINSSSDLNSSSELNPLSKIVKLTDDEIRKLRPIKQKQPSGNFKTVLPESWSHYISVAIFKATRLPCAFAYKKGAIKDGNLNISGSCSECGATVHVGSEKNLEFLKIDIVSGKENYPHYKKRRIRIAQQIEMAPEISKLTASTYINKRAAEEMEDGDFIPPYIPNKGKKYITFFSTLYKIV